MKTKIQAFLVSILLILSTSFGSIAFASDFITVKLNGQALSFDVPPQIINGRTMVPMRSIFEALGATVAWDENTQTITSVKGSTTIKLAIGSPYLLMNQSDLRELDAAPCVIADRTLVPVRAVSEAFQLNVDWEEATKTVSTTSPNGNLGAYNQLKNILLAKGDSSVNKDDYILFYDPDNQNYDMILSYDSKEDLICFYFTNKGYGEDLEETVLILMYPDQNAILHLEIKTSSGKKYEMLAHYPEQNQPYLVLKDTFPQYLTAHTYELLNSTLAIMDYTMQTMVQMSFADFGLYYNPSR